MIVVVSRRESRVGRERISRGVGEAQKRGEDEEGNYIRAGSRVQEVMIRFVFAREREKGRKREKGENKRAERKQTSGPVGRAD